MASSDFGIWAMLAFWATAIGGIVGAVRWASARGRNPASRKLIIQSLEQRLADGEITPEEYDLKMKQLSETGQADG
jgi:putative membrane protein